MQARDQTTVLQNEYSTWVVRDKHAHAFVNLTNPVGTRIAKIMGLPSPDTAPRCLACHALDVPADQRARTFDLTDGVGCENCHGPASAWLGPHTTRGWKYEKSLELGLYDTRDLVKRSEKCLSCHLGTPEKSVDHELIAAGHPDLYFELDSFMSVMPPHWKEVDTDPWFAVRAMGVGQAVQLREQLKRVARESQNGIWPEYAELDCFACHHNLTAAKDSWRQERGYAGRPPSRQCAVQPFALRGAEPCDPGCRSGRHARSESGHRPGLCGRHRAQLEPAASGVGSNQHVRAGRPAGHSFELDEVRSAADAASAEEHLGRGDGIAEQGERSAEQATMALDSLFIAYTKNGKLANDSQIRAAINGLFRQLDDPSALQRLQVCRRDEEPEFVD